MTKELTNAEKREMFEQCKKEFKALQDKYPFVEWYGSLMHANCMLPLIATPTCQKSRTKELQYNKV